jgi:5-hydroxyisourate hydrolase
MISTHILDLNLGTPACGVTVSLEKEVDTGWELVKVDETDADGRIVYSNSAETGIFKLSFQIEDYFEENKQEAFFLEAPIIFEIKDTTRKYHIPLLLSPYGFSTYRGS